MFPSTILRVKRRLEDNPQDAIIITCKRIKTDTEELSPSLFVFKGTVDNEESSNIKSIIPKCQEDLKLQHNVMDIIQKLRKERKMMAHDNRYEVVNCSRRINNDSLENDDFDLVDLQRKESELNEKETSYAYDLYVTGKPDFNISMLDNLVSIENYESELIFGTYRDNGRRTPSDKDQSSDDSNDENNWRNEYPDTENSSIDEEDIRKAMENCDIDDLSSDENEDKIYDDPPGLFSSDDASRYGKAYAQYKVRVLSEQNNSLVHCSKIDKFDPDVEGYKNDSDDGFYYGEECDTEQFREQYKNDSSDDCDKPD